MEKKQLKRLKKLSFILALAFWGLVSLSFWQDFKFNDGKLHLVFCDVGQGDATLISFKTTQVLIDGGPSQRVLSCLSKNMPFWDRRLEIVVLSHPQADHFTGLIDVIQRYSVRQFVSNSIINDTAGFREFYQAVLAEKAPVYSPKKGERIKIGPIQLLALWPEQRLGDSRIWTDAGDVLGAATYSGELNETSIVLQLSFGDFDALFTGDISSEIEEEIMGGLHTEPVEVLKVPHHGSKYSTSEEFLREVRPQLAVISVGKNSYGHPAKETLRVLRDLGVKSLRTDQDGEIEIVSDGERWRVRD